MASPNASVPRAEQTLEQRIAEERSKHSCLRRLDELMFCMTPTHQLSTYYATGRPAPCPQYFRRWQTCMHSRVSKPAEALKLLHDERTAGQSGQHVFMFKPEYAREAYQRYGVPEPSAGSSAAATVLPP